tara:strand:- start:55 stop:312 length:258 start_codon:yes stop_codon:yes gene_type:complete
MNTEQTRPNLDNIYELKTIIMTINLDTINPTIFTTKILNKYKVELIQTIELDNIFELTFKASKQNLKTFYNKYYYTGESFEDYIN